MPPLTKQNVEQALALANQYKSADWHWLRYVADSDLLLLEAYGKPHAYLAFLEPRSICLPHHFCAPEFSLVRPDTSGGGPSLAMGGDRFVAIRSEERDFHIISREVAFFVEREPDLVSRRYQQGVALSGADLRGACLRGEDLRDAVLTGADLRDANLQYAILEGANLRDARLDGASLRFADLGNARIRGSSLRHADLTGVTISGLRQDVAGLVGPDLTGATLAHCEITDADLDESA